MNFAPGVDVDKIRGGKRTVAGLKGEEVVLRMFENKTATLRFGWQYAGQKDSGEHPEISIEIESKDTQLEEKLKVWDALLDSIKPIGR